MDDDGGVASNAARCGHPECLRWLKSNWIQTIPGKGWFLILRLYGPLEPWLDQTWRPGEIELQG
jgi:hypothetical protein